MFLKCEKNFLAKTMSLIICIYIVLSAFIISFAENYEWTVINNFDAIETNSNATSEGDGDANKAGNNVTDNI